MTSTCRKLLKNALYAALGALVKFDRDLIADIFGRGMTERELAVKYGFKQSKSINYHKKRILAILRRNERLSAFFN
jgi:hypothetical protein